MLKIIQRHPVRTILVPTLLALLLAIPLVARAHPMGDFAISRYSRLELGAEQVDVTYVVDMAEVPTFQEQDNVMDTDGDGFVSATEADEYLAQKAPELAGNLSLSVDGTPVELSLVDQAMEFPEGDGGLPITRITLRLAAPLNASEAAWSLDYNDDNFSGRVGWQEIVVQAQDGVVLLESSAATEDISNELREYPESYMLDVSSASLRFEPAGLSGATESVQVSARGETSEGGGYLVESERDQQFANLINTQLDNPRVLVIVFFTALVAGAAHAMSPGHGKTIVAAYLVGSRGTPAHAVFLGLTTTVTHTLGVFGIGLITLFASQYIVPEQLYPWIGVFSGLLVIGIGWSLFRNRLRNAVNPDIELADDHAHEFSGDGALVHSHGGGAAHSHMPPTTAGGISWGNLFALGVSGGLLPCPAALVLMLGAISLGRVGFGLLLILIFSVGLASVLTAIGLVWVKARDLVDRFSGEGGMEQRWPLLGRALEWGPAVSAGLITLAGVVITYRALIETGVI